MASKRKADVIDLTQEIAGLQKQIAAFETAHSATVLKQLDRLRTIRDTVKQRDGLDDLIWKELLDLLRKLIELRKSDNPPPALIRSLLEEIIMLLLKLVYKAWLLQGLELPKIDPRLAADLGPARR
jgi:hypothetical protein